MKSTSLKEYQYDTILKKYGIIFLIILWLFTIAVHLYLNGLFSGLEAEKYIQEAQILIHHKRLSASRFIFYSPTILIIYLSLKIHAGLYGAFLIQALYNLFITLFFYKSLHHYFNNWLYPFFTTFLLIIFLPYSSWTVYLYTESLFYSNILLLTSALLNHNTNKSKRNLLLILFALFLVILSRPLGILFLLPTLIYFFVHAGKKVKIIFLPTLLLATGILIFLSNIIFSTITDVTITLAASQECIICGILPDHTTQLNLADKGSPVFQLYYYVTNNFDHFIRLGIIKLKYFFMMVRSYYSPLHNVCLLAFNIPLYLLCIVHIFSKKQKLYQPLFFFQLSCILIFAFTIMLQCDDYHNRFVLSLYPIFLLMAVKGLERLLMKLRIKKRS